MENKVIKAGTKIVIHTFACVGAEGCTAYILERDYTETELSDIAWQEGVQYAESYGIYPPSEDTDTDTDEDEGDEYSEDIEGWWELYNAEEHDGLLIYGNNRGFKFNSL
jgi:hypothetical protein